MSEEFKAYRLYDLVSRKIVVCRDVIFEEKKNVGIWGKLIKKLDLIPSNGKIVL